MIFGFWALPIQLRESRGSWYLDTQRSKVDYLHIAGGGCSAYSIQYTRTASHSLSDASISVVFLFSA